jgi:YD repeat-containing protein
MGRLTAVTTPLGNEEQYAYDEIGEKISQTDANQHKTNFAYDDDGRMIQKTLPSGHEMYETYNADGSLATVTDYNGNTVAMGYDTAGRLVDKYEGSPSGAVLYSAQYNADGTLNSETKSCATKLSVFNGQVWSGLSVDAAEISSRRLLVGFEDGAATVEQMQAIQTAQQTIDNAISQLRLADPNTVYNDVTFVCKWIK